MPRGGIELSSISLKLRRFSNADVPVYPPMYPAFSAVPGAGAQWRAVAGGLQTKFVLFVIVPRKWRFTRCSSRCDEFALHLADQRDGRRSRESQGGGNTASAPTSSRGAEAGCWTSRQFLHGLRSAVREPRRSDPLAQVFLQCFMHIAYSLSHACCE